MSSGREQDEFFHGPAEHQLLRMLINLMTCIGAGISSVALFLSFYGHIRQAWLLVAIALVVDSVDGTLIRVFELKAMAPQFDGDRLDEYADLISFVLAPVGIALASGLLSLSLPGLLTAGTVVATSSLQFSYQNAKTKTAFWGFPSYWNIVYFYCWALGITTSTVLIISWGLVLTLFLPIPFLYPSRSPVFKWFTIVLGIVWGIALLYYVSDPTAPKQIIYYSFIYPIYYVVVSVGSYKQLSQSRSP